MLAEDPAEAICLGIDSNRSWLIDVTLVHAVDTALLRWGCAPSGMRYPENDSFGNLTKLGKRIYP